MTATASRSPWHRLEPGAGTLTLHLLGDWRLARLAELEAAVPALPRTTEAALVLDGQGLQHLDSAGAMVLIRRLLAAGVAWPDLRLQGFDARQTQLLNLVETRLETAERPEAATPTALARLGRQAHRLAGALYARLATLGHASAALAEALLSPRHLRLRELFVQFEMVGLRALPITSLMAFLIGVVFAYLLGLQIEKYGANIFIVDGVGLAICRELAPMLVAVIVAGRSGAAFTAQLGTMKVTEEVDAIVTLGLSPFQVLVLPRLFALVLTLPLLVFAGDIAGLFGAMLVAEAQLGIGFAAFLARLQEVLALKQVVIGLVKAPFFAAAIALIACHNGLNVGRDARSVGLATTATVVQSIVAVILLDAFFAILLAEFDL